MTARPVPDRLRAAWSALLTNRHLVAFAVAVFAAMAVFPGSPARLLAGGAGAPARPAVQAPPPTAMPLPSPLQSGGASLTIDGEVDPLPAEGPPLVAGGDLGSPPPQALPPPVPCDIDDLVATVHQLRVLLIPVVGPVPGETLGPLAQLLTGCGDHDPTAVLVEVAIEISTYVPDLGLPMITLPAPPLLPALPLVPEVIQLLGPASDPIRDACGELALLALLFVVMPPAFNLPVTSSDLLAWMAPVNAICTLFDRPAG